MIPGSKKIKIQTVKNLLSQKVEKRTFDLSELSDEARKELRENYSDNLGHLDSSKLSEKTINEIEASRI